jgi:hypothetical protein
MLSDFASLANGPLKQYPLRRQTLTQGFLEHGIEVTTSGHLNPYSLGPARPRPCLGTALGQSPPAPARPFRTPRPPGPPVAAGGSGGQTPPPAGDAHRPPRCPQRTRRTPTLPAHVAPLAYASSHTPGWRPSRGHGTPSAHGAMLHPCTGPSTRWGTPAHDGSRAPSAGRPCAWAGPLGPTPCGDTGRWQSAPAHHPAWGTTRHAGATHPWTHRRRRGRPVPGALRGSRHRWRRHAEVDGGRTRCDDRARTRHPGRTPAIARHQVVWGDRRAARSIQYHTSAPTTRR